MIREYLKNRSDYEFDKLDELDDELNEFNDVFDELDEFDDEYDFFLNEFNEDYDETFSILNHNTIFIEVNKNLIKFFLMLLLRFKYNYIKYETNDDFDFNKDLSILYKEKYDKTSNAFNRATKNFDKILKIYDKNKNKFPGTVKSHV
jgi:hypothetical protein